MCVFVGMCVCVDKKIVNYFLLHTHTHTRTQKINDSVLQKKNVQEIIISYI